MDELPGDHWIYDEGASITFIAPSLGPGALISRPQGAPPSAIKGAGTAKVNTMATRLLEALNLFLCRVAGEPEAVLATEHGDRGVVQSVGGT